jgi:ribosomal protein L44E
MEGKQKKSQNSSKKQISRSHSEPNTQYKNLVQPHPQREEYKQSGVYQMRCMDCPLKYIG